MRIMNSPGGINNHPVIIRAQYGSVGAGYMSGGLQPNPARTIVLELYGTCPGEPWLFSQSTFSTPA